MSMLSPGSRGQSSDSHRYVPLRTVVHQYGWRAVVPLLIAALFAFLPLAGLIWFRFFRLSATVAASVSPQVVVASAQFEENQEQQQPGETGLLQVKVYVPALDGQRELLQDADPRRARFEAGDSYFVQRQLVYLRKAGIENLPFGLLGPPPVSIWLPEGEYDIAVVHGAPAVDEFEQDDVRLFPLMTVLDTCEVKNREKVVRRVELPHSGHLGPQSLKSNHHSGSSLAQYIAAVTAVPTPGGYLLALPEPQWQHEAEHRGCTCNFSDLQPVPREWTREQLVTVRNWLPPADNAAADRLSTLIDALGWREFFAGWFCYAVAGVTGLVFTHWGALAILEPYRRRESFWESVGLCVKIFLWAAGAWLLLQVLTDGGGCSGPVRFRM